MRRIGLSLGLVDNPHDGLGEFCMQLVQRIADAAPAWRREAGVAIDVQLLPAWRGRFGPAVGYLDAEAAPGLGPAQGETYAVWHVLHQHNRIPAPPGSAHRLLTVHDLNYRVGRSWLTRWRYGKAMAALLARTDEVVAISAYTAQMLHQHTPWRGPTNVIHNGVTDLHDEPHQALPGLERLAGRPYLFHLSRMAPSKNPQVILALAQAWPEMDFLLCGPPSADSLAIERNNRLPNVHVRLGITVAQKAWAYAHCSGFLFPSLTEGFGLPAIEAMYFGKPVFLSRLTALPEVGGDAACYFDDWAPAAMRAIVEAGLDDAASREQAVRAHAARFNWDRAALEYLQVYAQALGLPHAPG